MQNTHFLLEAPSMLNLESQNVYVTYNSEKQNLSVDKGGPGKRVLLHILFGLLGTGQIGASSFLVSES